MGKPKSGQKEIEVFAQREVTRDGWTTVHLQVEDADYWRQGHNREGSRTEWYRLSGDPPFTISEDGKEIENERFFTLLEALYERCTDDEYDSGLP